MLTGNDFKEPMKKFGVDNEIISGLSSFPIACHVYPKTEAISTYLYAIIAGPFEVFYNDAADSKNYVPMRILARKTFAKFVDAKEYFKLTMRGMDYYADFFGVAYPFRKYDQIFVAEFNAGAMENVGAVTFNESYIPRSSQLTQSDKEDLAITFLHELAHMWFGNLVTMKWWDDLWLNESFATFMSHICQQDAKGLEDYTLSWEIFNSCKEWGLATDQFNTTHPIAAACKNTEEADEIFDGISYGKGSAFLKELCFMIGEKTLRVGMKKYFKKFAHKNTELVDFIGSLNEACIECKVNVDLI
jgi:aminopeptidase N